MLKRQSLPIDGPPARSLPIWGRRVEFEHFLVELVPAGVREFNVKLGRTFSSISFSATEGVSTLAGDRLRKYDRLPFEYIIVPPDFPLRGTSQNAPEVLAFVVDFPALQAEIESSMGAAPGSVKPDVFLGSPVPFTSEIAKRIRRQLLSDEPPQLYLEALCISLIVEMFRPMAERRKKRDQVKVEEKALRMLLGYIDENLDADLSVGAMSELLGATKDQLASAFGAFVGQPPHTYVLHRRIDRAREKLIETDSPLAQVALEMGFSSQSHMTTAFKQNLGATPGAVRRSYL